MAVKLWKGDTGESVRDLQRQLNQSGYGLDEDGVFGNKTYDAVLDYQRKNNLDVDGVVGNETWGSLGKQQAQQAAPAQQSAPAASTYTPYDPSSNQAYQEALAALKNAQGGTPQYNGTYDGQLKDLYDKIVNREKFSYDIAGDPLYQQYKDQYTLQGKMAMMDTMGQAAGLTGGYGSSYGQAVGQQQLTDVIPELYKQAYAQYQDEGDALSKQYGMLGDLASDEYSKYQDAYNRWFAERGYAQDNADEAYNRGYNQWLQELNQRNADREYEMEQRQFEESVRQYNETLAENKRQFDAQQAAAAAARAASAYSGSSSGGSSGKRDTVTVSKTGRESASGAGITSFSNVKRTISGYLQTGERQQAEQLISDVWDQLSKYQKEEIQKMGFVIS